MSTITQTATVYNSSVNVNTGASNSWQKKTGWKAFSGRDSSYPNSWRMRLDFRIPANALVKEVRIRMTTNGDTVSPACSLAILTDRLTSDWAFTSLDGWIANGQIHGLQGDTALNSNGELTVHDDTNTYKFYGYASPTFADNSEITGSFSTPNNIVYTIKTNEDESPLPNIPVSSTFRDMSVLIARSFPENQKYSSALGNRGWLSVSPEYVLVDVVYEVSFDIELQFKVNFGTHLINDEYVDPIPVESNFVDYLLRNKDFRFKLSIAKDEQGEVARVIDLDDKLLDQSGKKVLVRFEPGERYIKVIPPDKKGPLVVLSGKEGNDPDSVYDEYEPNFNDFCLRTDKYIEAIPNYSDSYRLWLYENYSLHKDYLTDISDGTYDLKYARGQANKDTHTVEFTNIFPGHINSFYKEYDYYRTDESGWCKIPGYRKGWCTVQIRTPSDEWIGVDVFWSSSGYHYIKVPNYKDTICRVARQSVVMNIGDYARSTGFAVGADSKQSGPDKVVDSFDIEDIFFDENYERVNWRTINTQGIPYTVKLNVIDPRKYDIVYKIKSILGNSSYDKDNPLIGKNVQYSIDYCEMIYSDRSDARNSVSLLDIVPMIQNFLAALDKHNDLEELESISIGSYTMNIVDGQFPEYSVDEIWKSLVPNPDEATSYKIDVVLTYKTTTNMIIVRDNDGVIERIPIENVAYIDENLNRQDYSVYIK